MKKLLILIITIFLSNGLFAQNDSIYDAFRSVTIDKDRKVKLQSDIKDLLDISVKTNKRFYHLKKGTYLYVDSIGIETNDKSKIMALTFHYGYDSSYVKERVYLHEQKKYQKIFQDKGKEYLFKSANFFICVTKWEGKTTSFELIETIINGKLTVYSRIFDKELYYAQYGKKINLAKEDNSLELLRRLGLF